MDTPSDVIGRAASVLRALSRLEPQGSSTSALARATALPRATAHRLLTSLQDNGLVDRDPETGRWYVGPDMYLMGAAATARYDATAVAHPFVRRLAIATGESAFFSQRRGDETVCLIREDGNFPLRSHVLSEGSRFPLGVVSSGMAVLALLSDREITDYLDRTDLTTAWGTQFDRAGVLANVARTREDGYALNPGLVVPGSWGIAVAVTDGAGQPRWTLSITGVEQRFTSERLPELVDLLGAAARGLAKAIAPREAVHGRQ